MGVLVDVTLRSVVRVWQRRRFYSIWRLGEPGLSSLNLATYSSLPTTVELQTNCQWYAVLRLTRR